MPVDKHGSVKVFPPPKWSTVKYLNFAITKDIVIFFAEILHKGRAAIDMKHIKQDLSFSFSIGSHSK